MANNPETTVTFRVFNSDFKKKMKEMTAESTQLRNEFLLQQERMKGTASEVDKLTSRIQYFEQQQEIVGRQVAATREQLERARQMYGENSQEVATLTAQLQRAELHEARLANNLREANEELADQTDVARRAGEALSKAGQKMKDVGTTLSTTVTPALSALGIAAGMVATEAENSFARIKNSLGLTAEEAKELTSVAREIYNDGFGESLEEIETALIQTRQNIKGLNNEDLGEITTKAKVLADTFDSEVNEVVRGGNNIMQAFGISADEAFDLMAYGAQNGLNFSNEMFDNLAEYSSLFGKMGFSAQEYFQLLIKGSQEGVYNLDYINDVMKEFQIRIKDGSDATSQAFADMTKESQEVWDKFYYGEATVKDVFNTVIADLQSMEDQTYANQLGVALFGR